MMQTAAPTYTVLGTTDDCTECDVCGKTELKGTMVLQAPDGDTLYAGMSCGAKLAGRPVRELRTEAATADRARRDAEQAAAETARAAASAADNQAFMTWVLARYGVTATQPSDLWGKVPNLTPFALGQQWRAVR